MFEEKKSARESLKRTYDKADTMSEQLLGLLREVEESRTEAFNRLQSYPNTLERDKALLDELSKRRDIIKSHIDELEEPRQANVDRMREVARMAYDWFKHLTTVSTGSILLIAVLLRDFFPEPRWIAALFVAFVCLILAAAGSVLGMVGRVEELSAGIVPDETDGYSPKLLNAVMDRFSVDKVQDYLFLLVIVCFFVGILSFVTFVLRNVGS